MIENIVKFCPYLPANVDCKLINTDNYCWKEYLMVNTDSPMYYEIRGEYKGVFKQAELVGNTLVIGIFDKLYLYNISTSEIIYAYQCNWYFGSFERYLNHIYICDSQSIACIREDGELIWENKDLGIDGVIISSIDDEIIGGKGEWDPSGGWKDFKIRTQTGLKVNG